MNKRIIPTTLLLISSLTAAPVCDWQERGERWGEPHQLSEKKLTDNTTLFGVITLRSVKVEKNLTCYGSTELSDVTVDGVTTMFGSLKAVSSHLHDIDVRSSDKKQGTQGTVLLDNVTAKNVTLCAHLLATGCNLERVTLFSENVSLNNSKIQELVIMNSKPVIELVDTIVEGTVTFSRKGGIIICKGTSQVKGSVINGTIK